MIYSDTTKKYFSGWGLPPAVLNKIEQFARVQSKDGFLDGSNAVHKSLYPEIERLRQLVQAQKELIEYVTGAWNDPIKYAMTREALEQKNKITRTMRPIKFRAKTINGKWVEGDLLHGQGAKEGNMYILPQTQFYPSDCDSLDGYLVDPSTVSQYTGQKDDFGKEIYEGDIVEPGFVDPNDPARVEKGLLVKFEVFDDHQGFSLDLDSPLKVIGNKWDNPEIEYYEHIDKYNPKL